MKISLLVFASEEKYVVPTLRLVEQAKEINVFDNIIVIEPNNYPDYFKKFIDINYKFFDDNPRGYGYWIWKAFLVDYQLKNVLCEDDILFYADAGCELSLYGRKTLLKYIEIVKSYGGLFFNTKFKEGEWTKMDLISLLGAVDVLKRKQVQATFFFLKNTSANREITSDWINIATSCNFHYIDDSPSILENSKGFVEHRHDQSILSLLVKRNNLPVINCDFLFSDYLYYVNSYILTFPVHALRNISEKSKLSSLIKNSKEHVSEAFLSRAKFEIIRSWLNIKHQIYIKIKKWM